jgi:hypothetical protein
MYLPTYDFIKRQLLQRHIQSLQVLPEEE